MIYTSNVARYARAARTCKEPPLRLTGWHFSTTHSSKAQAGEQAMTGQRPPAKNRRNAASAGPSPPGIRRCALVARSDCCSPRRRCRQCCLAAGEPWHQQPAARTRSGVCQPPGGTPRPVLLRFGSPRRPSLAAETRGWVRPTARQGRAAGSCRRRGPPGCRGASPRKVG